MFVKSFKRSEFFGVFLILLTGVVFWAGSLLSPTSLDEALKENQMPLFTSLLSILSGIFYIQVYIGFFLILFNTWLINRLSSSFLLFKKGTKLPGFFYLTIVSSFEVLQNLHPVHIAVFLLLTAFFYIFSTYQKELEIGFTFNASFLLALATLFYLPSVILLPLIWISIFILQKSDNWRLLVVPILGFIVPWLFAVSVSFLNDSLKTASFNIIRIIWADNNEYLQDPFFLILSAFMIFLVLLGSFSYLTNYQFIKISSRKYFLVFYWMMVLVGISALSFTTISIEIIAFLTIPAAFLISMFFLSGEKYFWKELIFSLLIGFLVYGKFFY